MKETPLGIDVYASSRKPLLISANTGFLDAVLCDASHQFTDLLFEEIGE